MTLRIIREWIPRRTRPRIFSAFPALAARLLQLALTLCHTK